MSRRDGVDADAGVYYVTSVTPDDFGMALGALVAFLIAA